MKDLKLLSPPPPAAFVKFSKSYRGDTEDVVLDSVPSSSQSQYEFMSGNDLSCYVEKP
ncbi:hypothetical protein SLEP1_g43390 [Rubroshorea leprosula]|uniref:Uncharacterized protein n=1 Tax=Rubroshorea leprosula TaxID=152421 RepID=A0AAV5LCT4_9ROSI|nr:hypothetical protein SLEP1_g43390 [Rubroshorea leprosula]